VTPTVALLSLLLAPTAPGAAAQAGAPPPCQSFSRDSQTAPPLVRAWFATSADERVVVCPQGAAGGGEPPAPLYFGEGAVTRRGEVCSYRSHGLTLSGSGETARLQRYERSEALDMALAGTGCPTPHGGAGTAAYVETYDISPAAFEEIMRLWSAAAAAAAGGDEHCCSAHDTATPGAAGTARTQPRASELRIAPEAREHLEAALGPDHLLTPTVTRIVRIPDSVLRHRYALFLTVSDTAAGSPALYVVYVDKTVRHPYQITAFAETN
jgi:hypothetical protein